MGDQCSPADKDEVKAILEAVNKLNDRDELINKIKQCAKQTELTDDQLTSSIEKISDITLKDLEEAPTPGAGGGKRKSKKNKSKKSKSKKRRSKRRKHRKMRRTRK